MPRTISEIISKASKIVTPSLKEERALKVTESKIRALLENSFSKSKLEPRPEISLGGSYAKGTWLKGSGDIDHFLLFPESYPRERLEGEAIDVVLSATKGFEVEMRYAEHPYVEAFVGATRINIVPSYKVEKGKWQSAVDRSPFHTEYIRSRFDSHLRLETRLLKKFTKASNLYGAEVKVQGFSGYVCEVLVLKYGSMESVLRAFSSIKKGEVISAEPYDKQVAASFSSALVILDPVDTGRNLATAISGENIGRFILKARSFLSRPSMSYFQEKPLAKIARSKPDPEVLKRILVVTFHNKPRSVDILWGQLRKSASALASKLANLGFEVLRNSAASDEAGDSALIFLLLETKIPPFLRRTGPDVFRKEDLAKYVSKNRSKYLLTWLDGSGNTISLFKRDAAFADAFSTLKKLLSSKEVEKLGLSKAICLEIKKGFKINDGLSIIQGRDKRGWLKKDVISLVTSDDGFGA